MTRPNALALALGDDLFDVISRVGVLERRDQIPSSTIPTGVDDEDSVLVVDAVVEATDRAADIETLEARLESNEEALSAAAVISTAAAEAAEEARAAGLEAAAEAEAAADYALERAEVAKSNADDALVSAAEAVTAAIAARDAIPAIEAAAEEADRKAVQAGQDALAASQSASDAAGVANAAKTAAQTADAKAVTAQTKANDANTAALAAAGLAATKGKTLTQVSKPTGSNADPANLWINTSLDGAGKPRNTPNGYGPYTVPDPNTVAVILPPASAQTETEVMRTSVAQNAPTPIALTLSASMALNGLVKSSIARLRDGVSGAVLASYVFSDKGDNTGGNAETWTLPAGFTATPTSSVLVVTIQSNNANSPTVYSLHRTITANDWQAITDQKALDAAAAAATAASAASTAQSTADTAKTNAATAQQKANDAASAAAAADTKAANAASAAATAQASADGKTTDYYSPNAPSTATPGKTVGDTWFVRMSSTGIVTGVYEWTGTAWQQRTLDNATIANLDAGKITAGFIAAARIAAGTITGTHIAAATIQTANLAAGAITTDLLAANAITAAKIAADAITSREIAADAITAAELAADAVLARNIKAGEITAGKIAANAIAAANIQAGAIGVDQLAANAVTAQKIAAGAVTAVSLAADAIDGKTITGVTISGGTVNGAVVQTSASGKRVVLSNNRVNFYGVDGTTAVNAGVIEGLPNGAAGGLINVASATGGTSFAQFGTRALPTSGSVGMYADTAWLDSLNVRYLFNVNTGRGIDINDTGMQYPALAAGTNDSTDPLWVRRRYGIVSFGGKVTPTAQNQLIVNSLNAVYRPPAGFNCWIDRDGTGNPDQWRITIGASGAIRLVGPAGGAGATSGALHFAGVPNYLAADV